MQQRRIYHFRLFAALAVNKKQIKDLRCFVQLLPSDENMLLYFWRFVFGMDVKTIRRFSQIEYANGIIEALRFACKRYLEIDKTISNTAMGNVFVDLIKDYEILLVSASSGICWVRDKCICTDLIKKAIVQHNKGL